MSDYDWSWKPQPGDAPKRKPNSVKKKPNSAKRRQKSVRRGYFVQKDIVPEGARDHIRSIMREGK